MFRKLMVWMAVLAFGATTGLAQSDSEETAKERKMGVGILLSQIGGDIVTSEVFDGGLRPALDDTTSFGAFFYNDFKEHIRFEFRVQSGSSTFFNTPMGNVKTKLHTIDFALIPNWQFGKLDLGFPVGAGWGITQAKSRLADNTPTGDPSTVFGDGNGIQFFLGVRPAWKINDRWGIFLDIRARRYTRLVNVREINVGTIDAAIGVSFAL